MKNTYYYKGANPTVDLIVINPENKILLIKRAPTAGACPNMWAIPGGFINTTAKNGEIWKEGLEKPEEASIRELEEETNLKLENPKLTFVGCFEGNSRDPRDNEESWSKSYAFVHVIDSKVYLEQKHNIIGMDDATKGLDGVDWKSIDEINELTLAFDHNDIIKEAIKVISANKIKRKI